MEHGEASEAERRWLHEMYLEGRLSDEARRVCEIARRDMGELEEFYLKQLDRLARYHEERYTRLEAAYHRVIGIGLNCEQRYQRWVEQTEDHALMMTSSPEEIERFKEDLIRRIEHYRSRTKHRRSRGRRVGSRNYTHTVRRQAVEDYARRRRRGLSREAAAGLVGHKSDTLEKWARELGFDCI